MSARKSKKNIYRDPETNEEFTSLTEVRKPKSKKEIFSTPKTVVKKLADGTITNVAKVKDSEELEAKVRQGFKLYEK